MKVMIVDDEKPTLDLMVRSLTAFADLEIVGAFELPSMALRASEQLTAARLDAAFLDISLPGMNGIELALRLQELAPDLQVVFVTAFDQYALQAFDAHALDYVLKPVDDERLQRSVERLRKGVANQQCMVQKAQDEQLTAVSDLPVPSGQVWVKLPAAGGIAVFDSQGQKVRFSTAKQEDLLRDLIETPIELHKWDLIQKYWPELDAKRAEQNLYMTIYRLKQTIREFNLPFRLSSDKGRYRLEMTSPVTLQA